VTIRYVNGSNTFNGDGTGPGAAASNGAAGAFNAVPSNTFSTDTWRLIAGSTLSMGGTGLTTGHNAIIEKYGAGANPVITGTNATLLNSSTATGVSISDITILRSGAVTGTGYNASQTTGANLQRCTITGSQSNISANDAVSLTVNACTLGGGVSTEYGIITNQATTTCSGWTISNNTFNTGIGISLQASNAANAAGRYTSLAITGNTFPASASSAIIMQSVMNLTDYANSMEVTSTTTIVRRSGPTAFPLWTAGQVVFLTGFVDPINYGERTVVSIANDTPIAGQQTLTVSGTALAVEANSIGKGMGLIDAARMFVDPVISNNVCTGQSQTPMLLASFTGSSSRINNNTISNQVGSDYVTAAAIEMIYMQPGLIVDYNTVGQTTGSMTIDNAGIFLDGGCNGVIVRNNTISNVIPGTLDNSGQGTAFFYATNCTVENNTLTNCYRGTWAGGTGGSGNIIRNNSYAGCDIGVEINVSPAPGAFNYATGNTFDGNRLNVYAYPDGLTVPGLRLPFDVPTNAQVFTGVYGVCWLIEMDFSGGMVYATTAPVNVDYGGHSYTGLGNLVQVGGLSESENNSAEKLSVSVSVVDSTMLALVLVDANTYRGRSITLRLQLLTETFAPIGTPVKRWAGAMNPAKVTRGGHGGENTGRIELPCSRYGMARARNYQGLRHTHAQQLLRFPGDVGLQYMQDLIEKPALWLSKRFQEQT